MPELVWDKPDDRIYQTGLDHAVLYLPDGSAVPWNGLTSVVENFSMDVAKVYYDGMHISDLVSLGSFAATMKAVTYPEEFELIDGMGSPKNGIFFTDQALKTFALSYRVAVGQGSNDEPAGYKIHIIYNITAIPKDRTYATMSENPSLVEFEWDLSAIPEETPGYRPTAHIVLDSRDLDPWLYEDLTNMLYGSDAAFAVLIPMPDLVKFINDWFRVKITDNGDGTWTAMSVRDGFISFDAIDPDVFDIDKINAVYLDPDTYIISDTMDISQTHLIAIIDNGDGTWSATTDQDILITEVDDGIVQILDANFVYVGLDSFQITDTTQ